MSPELQTIAEEINTLTTVEECQGYARRMLRLIPPFPEWQALLSPESIRYAECHSGTVRGFYDWMVGKWTGFAGMVIQ